MELLGNSNSTLPMAKEIKMISEVYVADKNDVY